MIHDHSPQELSEYLVIIIDPVITELSLLSSQPRSQADFSEAIIATHVILIDCSMKIIESNEKLYHITLTELENTNHSSLS